MCHNQSIFLCHNNSDKLFVEKLANDLLDNGIDVWFDKWEIRVGDSIIEKIQGGLANFRYMGVVLSPASIEAPWVKKEINSALIKEISQQSAVVLPILYRACIIPPFLQDKRYADFSNDYDSGFHELLDVFGFSTKISKKPILKNKMKRIIQGHLIKGEIIDNIYKENFYDDNFFDNNLK